MNTAEYLRIGQIVRPHGVRGAVKLEFATDFPERFRGLKEAYIELRDGYRPVACSDVRLLNDGVALKLSGVDTREAAEALRGTYLCVDRNHTVKLPENTWFVADLIGCEVSDTEGTVYGKITDVLETGANDVYEVAGGKLMVPALTRVIDRVDVSAKRMVLKAEVLREVGLFED